MIDLVMHLHPLIAKELAGELAEARANPPARRRRFERRRTWRVAATGASGDLPAVRRGVTFEKS